MINNDWLVIFFSEQCYQNIDLYSPAPNNNQIEHRYLCRPILSWYNITTTVYHFKMDITQSLISGSFIFVLFICANFGSESISKVKSCVEYRIKGGRWNHTILETVVNMTGQECLTQCVRDKHCGAYNIWHRHGICDLIPRVDTCGETDIQKGWTFVGLADCGKSMPWTTRRLDWTAESESPCLK